MTQARDVVISMTLVRAEVSHSSYGVMCSHRMPSHTSPLQLSISCIAELVPEEAFASRYPNPVTINVAVPNDPSIKDWSFSGQTLRVSLSVRNTVKDLKDMVGEQLGGMPANKQQLKGTSGFLKDSQSLASLNIGDGAYLELSLRSRGGKR